MLTVSAYSGKQIFVDTSAEACKPFGFQNGDLVKTINGETGMVIGVGVGEGEKEEAFGETVMWFQLDLDTRSKYFTKGTVPHVKKVKD